MTKTAAFHCAMGIAVAALLGVGAWDYAVSGAWKLIAVGMLALAFLLLAEKQRRAASAPPRERPGDLAKTGR